MTVNRRMSVRCYLCRSTQHPIIWWLQVIWVCILCRKKQELLSKTGQWMTKTALGAADKAMLRQMQEDMQVGGPQGPADQTQDKRPKLERAHSAAEKENLPLLQRSGNSLLRRQFSQQEQVTFPSSVRQFLQERTFHLRSSRCRARNAHSVCSRFINTRGRWILDISRV